MSAGAVFQLIANDGKSDRIIMATKLLNQRIKDVICARRRAGKADVTPTLVDLERTHILFVNAHFKPFAAIGYEYNKVRAQAGAPALGNTVTFSIPQFGDFFHDMAGRQVLSGFSSNLQASPTQAVAGAALSSTTFPAANRDWDNITTFPAGTTTTYSLVDPFGNAVAANTADAFRNLVRWCEFPGERLYQSVKFDVNGNPLDEYNDTTINMIRKFTIGADKITGYKRLVGQEVCHEGYSGPRLSYALDSQNNGGAAFTTLDASSIPTIPQRSINPASTSNDGLITQSFPDRAWNPDFVTAVDHATVSPAGTGYLNVNRECLQVVDGPQTPKYEQPSIEIWNKLRFWFNDDARLSVASVSIPFGGRFITIDLARQELLTFEFPGLYVRQVHEFTAAGVVTRTVQYRPFHSPGTISPVTVNRVELYVNNIFVNPEVHDIFIKRIGFSLIRVNRQHRVRTNSDDNDEKLLSSLKWPIEYMYVGLRPSWNIAAGNPQQWRDWHRMTKINDVVADKFDMSEVSAVAVPGDLASSQIFSRVGQIIPSTWVKELKTVDTLTVTAHGVAIHDNFPESFFNAYTPFHYGGSAIVTPSDEGVLMVNFALYPKSYQPSGHLNVSRAREFYVNWSTRYVGSSTPADFIAVAVAINFLLITDGSAVLRFST